MCPNSFVLLRKVLVKEGHWQPVGRCCLCLGVWQSQWQILCLVPSPDLALGHSRRTASKSCPTQPRQAREVQRPHGSWEYWAAQQVHLFLLPAWQLGLALARSRQHLYGCSGRIGGSSH